MAVPWWEEEFEEEEPVTVAKLEAAPTVPWWEQPEPEAAPPAPPAEEEEPSGFMQGVRGAARRVQQKYIAPAEVAVTMGTSMAAEVGAGLIGGAETLARLPFQGRDVAVEEGAKTAETIQSLPGMIPRSEEAERLMSELGEFMEPVGRGLEATEEFLGEGVLEVTGSPGLAAIAHTLPTAVLEATGLITLKKVSDAAGVAIRASKGRARRAAADRAPPKGTTEQVFDVMEELEPEQMTVADIVLDIKAKKTKQLAAAVKPDVDILDAAEELNKAAGSPISLNPADYSTSEAFIRVQQALHSQPESLLAAREADNITALGQRADNMIEEFGGDIDKGQFHQAMETQYTKMIGDLEDASDAAYDVVALGKKMPDGGRKGGIPPRTKVIPHTANAYIARRLEEMGGDVSGLSKAEKQLHDVVTSGEPITYARLDQLRRDIGDGFKSKGPFRDDSTGNLSQVYKVLIEDQQAVANLMGVGNEFKLGRKLVERRINMEQQAAYLIGKELDKSIVPKLKAAAIGLTKGDVKTLERLMEALPASMRQRAAVTMLNDLFTSGGRLGSRGIGQGFANAYAALNRQKTAKAALFKYLPEGAQKRFDAIGKVSSGIYRAKALANNSRTARDILLALSSMSMVGKITGAVARPVGAVAQMGGVPLGGIAASAVERGVKQGARRAKAADELMASPQFEKAIGKAMEGKVKEAEILLNRSKVWQAWRNTLGEGTQAQLAAVGAIAWLTEAPPPPLPPQEGEPSALTGVEPGEAPRR